MDHLFFFFFFGYQYLSVIIVNFVACLDFISMCSTVVLSLLLTMRAFSALSFVWRHWWALDPPHWDSLYIYHSVILFKDLPALLNSFFRLFSRLKFPMVKSHHNDCIWSLQTCCHAFSISLSSMPQRKCTALFTDKASTLFNLKKTCVYVKVQNQ